MFNSNYDTSEVERSLKEAVLKAGISKNVFTGIRPKKVNESMKDFVVVVCNRINDRNAFGRCTCRIEMFVKELSNGLKNGDKFSEMIKKAEKISFEKYLNYIFIPDDVIPLGSDGFGFYVEAIQVNTIIKLKN